MAHPSDPRFGLRIDARANDLSGFTPKAPVFLCGGAKDSTVSYANDTAAMARNWSGLGSNRVLVLDVDQSATSTSDPYFTEKLNFAIVKAATADQARLTGGDPDWEVARNYHAAVVPACASAVRKFFGKY